MTPSAAKQNPSVMLPFCQWKATVAISTDKSNTYPTISPTATAFSRWLVAAREAKGWSVSKLAKEIGANDSTIRGWEKGRENPIHRFRVQLQAIFGDVPPRV
jgi:ribosome-binding protein aMBF1 (putative translation factor)